MRCNFPALSLMLTATVLFCSYSISSHQLYLHSHFNHHGRLAGRDNSFLTKRDLFDTNTANPSMPKDAAAACINHQCIRDLTQTKICGDTNSSVLKTNPAFSNYELVCDIDFPGQDIYPFVLAGSFQECLKQCESLNANNGKSHCLGVVFAPDRANDSDDCYLKSSLNNPITATIHLIGATSISPSMSSASSSMQNTYLTRSSIHEKTATSSTMRTPSIQDVKLLGTSTNNPTKQYVSHIPSLPQKLASSMLVPGINMNLITDYSIAGDTGSWTAQNSPFKENLTDMTVIPHLSRDGGKGGTVNGTSIFIFCDTANFKTTTSTNAGDMVGFVSSSVATNDDMDGLNGGQLTLVDQIGEWQDDVGRMRSFAPMTEGEESFNIALSGDGHRYAVWPESSLIPLNETHALLYAVLVYDEVDMQTQAATFTTLGNTLLIVSVDSNYGPNAQRVEKLMFKHPEITFGSLGGLRAWGTSGIGQMDGNVYLFGQSDNGVLVAKTQPTNVTDISTYLYFDGDSWTSNMISVDSTATIFDGIVMDFDMIYSPYYRTFVLVYLNPYADNTFYYRWLKTDHDIIPPYENGGDPDYVENILFNNWSDEHILYKASTPAMGYIYAGGLHAGYFGIDDITNGGQKALLSWTEHTGKDAATPESGYAHKTVVVSFS